MTLNKEQIEIMKHTSGHSANGLYCGDSPDMQELVKMGMMESMGKKSFVHDEYFRLTAKGKVELLGILRKGTFK